MFEIIVTIAWVLGIVLGVMWLFLPWIMISKIDEIIDELRRINSKSIN